MDKFKTVLNVATKQQTSQLGFGLIALLTAGGEQIFSSVVFNCPCSSWNFLYGMVFLLVPAWVLLVLGYISSIRLWKLITGSCYRRSKLCRWKTCAAAGAVLFQITTTALVAPSSWIAVALLNGNYFQCAMTGLNVTSFKKHFCGETVSQSECQEELYQFPCGRGGTEAQRKDVLISLRAESQIMGWLLIASIVVTNLLLTCMARCYSPISYLQLKFWKAYTQEENSLMESYSIKHAKELADRNLKSFFQQKQPEQIFTPSNVDWQRISAFYRFSTKDHYYSTMHQFVEQLDANDSGAMRMASVRSDGPGANNPAVLAFVDEGKMML